METNWQLDGVLIKRNLFDCNEIDKINNLIEEMWKTGDNCIGEIGPCDYEGVYTTISENNKTVYKTVLDLSISQKENKQLKITDLYLTSPVFRKWALNNKLTSTISELLTDDPVLCSSLNVNFGTEQPKHVDAMFVTPPTKGAHVSVWVALEDAQENSGRFGYYQGSHKIPPYIFSDNTRKIGGTINRMKGEISKSKDIAKKQSEWSNWHKYMDDEIQKRNLIKKEFDAKKGDVIFWHADLVHWGNPRTDRSLTRKTAIMFYHSKSDYLDKIIIKEGNGYYLPKPTQPRKTFF